jgi:hypothetical protein
MGLSVTAAHPIPDSAGEPETIEISPQTAT